MFKVNDKDIRTTSPSFTPSCSICTAKIEQVNAGWSFISENMSQNKRANKFTLIISPYFEENIFLYFNVFWYPYRGVLRTQPSISAGLNRFF